ncbi:MAG: 23S rRNA (adenine(2503)-C(2))-methyltransferase RlmN [Puniceicoccales bacterium]|jgi:23S rRNA (adenine2503-C2)-methyltransferase|nr:23S rRNA (adenine(2503)-C(2))-methyltransferase RlmN [Puniceicoccales bacterium]
MTFTPEKPPIFAETPDTLKARLAAAGHAPFRAAQILGWIYQRNAISPATMTNLPAALREWLDREFDFAPNAPLAGRLSGDVTQKLLQRLRDGSLIETVVIRAPQDNAPDGRLRTTICISTQVGCAYGCKFCASGLEGLRRNLSAGEIVGQLMAARRTADNGGDSGNGGDDAGAARREPAAIDNIVVMGMGEPMDNYDNLLAALRLINAPWALGFGARRITVSTSGVAPKILALADEQLGVRLAVSLHGATNAVRDKIMPVNRRWPLEILLPACKTFAAKHGRMLTLEFILIESFNDTAEQMRALADIARSLHAHVNLIPYNKVEGLDWRRPSVTRQQWFERELKARGISVTLRREKGHDIEAACGQLRLQKERAERTERTAQPSADAVGHRVDDEWFPDANGGSHVRRSDGMTQKTHLSPPPENHSLRAQ